MVDYLIESKIAPTNSPLEMKCMGGEEDIFLQQILLLLGLKYNDFLQSKKLIEENS